MTKARFIVHKVKNEKGVTLIELVIVLVIVAILASLAAVGPGFLRSENISRFSRELYGDLHRARQDAMTRSVAQNSMGWGIRFATPTSYTIFEFNDVNPSNFQYDGTTEEANTTQRNLASSIVIQRFTGGGLVDPNNDVLIYDKLGIPRDSGWALAQITLVVRHQTDNTVQAKCVNVSTNKIREGLWDGNNCQEQ